MKVAIAMGEEGLKVSIAVEVEGLRTIAYRLGNRYACQVAR